MDKTLASGAKFFGNAKKAVKNSKKKTFLEFLNHLT